MEYNKRTESEKIKEPFYSICITTYNCAETLKDSLDSILNQIDNDFEVVVVDNFSTDGSQNILEEYANKNKLRLLKARCNRGEGRQIAFRESKGKYLIQLVDMDQIYKPVFKNLIKIYMRCGKEALVILDSSRKMRTSMTLLSTHRIIEQVGGWASLHFYEDKLMCDRLNGVSQLAVHYADISEHRQSVKRKNPIARLKFYALIFRDDFRLRIPLETLIKRTRHENKHLLNFAASMALMLIGWLGSIPEKHYEYHGWSESGEEQT